MMFKTKLRLSHVAVGLALSLVAVSCGETETATPSADASYDLAALPEQNKRTALLDLVIDIHGPAENLSEAVNRLVYFPDIGTTKGTDIVAVVAHPGSGTSGVEFITDAKIDDLVTFYETDLRGKGWTESQEPPNTTDYSGYAVKVREFERQRGGRDRPERLRFDFVDDTDLGLSFVKVDYNFDDVTIKDLEERFKGWDDDLPLPDGATYRSSSVSTQRLGLRTGVNFTTVYDYPDDETEQGLQDEIIRLANEAGQPHDKPYNTNVQLFGESELLEDSWSFDYRPSEFLDTTDLAVSATIEFERATLETKTSATLNEASEPLPKNASAEQAKATLTSMLGLTDDVSAQMQRIGSFPQVPTADVATITKMSSTVETEQTTLSVTFLSKAEPEALKTFYETAFADEGWTKNREYSDKKDTTTKVREIDFGFERGDDTAKVELLADPNQRSAQREVVLTYVEQTEPEAGKFDDYIGWVGNSPLPAGGEIESATLAIEEPSYSFSDKEFFVVYKIKRDYGRLNDDQTEKLLLESIDGSDYTLGESEYDYAVGLNHPDFVFVEANSGYGNVELEARKALT